MSSTAVIVLIVVIVVVLALVAALVYTNRRRQLRQKFGPEYDRAVEETGSRSAAEKELRAREQKHAELQLRELDPESRARYAQSWEQIQARFLDEPNAAVREADELVTQLVAERGYPTENYQDQIAHLSVDHARTLGHYRDAHEINLVNERGEATTEQLRQALVHYRELFADLLGTRAGDFKPDAVVRQDERTETDTPRDTSAPR